MRIGIDIRPLMENKKTGVAKYLEGLLHPLSNIGTNVEYKLFCNSYKKDKQTLFRSSDINAEIYKFNYPNKLLNFGFKFFNFPKINRLLGGVDLFFLPNFNFFALNLDVPFVVTVHDLSFVRYPEFFSLKRRQWHNFLGVKNILKKAKGIIAVSENTKKDLIELFKIRDDKISVIYSGLNLKKNRSEKTNKLKIKNKYNLPDDFILYLGTLEPRKNIVGIIKAFENLKAENKSKNIAKINLVLAGPAGWLYKDIFHQVRNSKFRRNIFITNFVAEDDKTELYGLAKAFVYPSFYEGFGFPPLEAQSQGVPVITSNSSSLPEIIKDSGILIDPYNVADITKSIFKVLTDEDARNLFVKKGYENAERFNWQTSANKTLSKLKEWAH